MGQQLSPSTSPIQADDRELVITRVFHAPAGLVFAAWATPEGRAAWWGPRGFMATHQEQDLRPGGAWRACLHQHEGGIDHWQSGVYHEVVDSERLVFTFAWDDDDGRRGHETLVTVTFAEHQGQTTMTFHQAVFESADLRDSHEDGWSSTFDRLAETLATV